VNILFLAQRVPYPPNRGDKITTFHEIRILAKRHRVHVACLAEDQVEASDLGDLESLCASVDVTVLPKWRSNAQAALSALGALPLTLPFYFSPELAAKVAYRVATSKIDLVHVFSSSMAQYADPYWWLPRVMQFADLDSIKWRQMGQMGKAPKSWLYSAEAVRLLWYERSIARRYDRCLVVTEQEREEMMGFIPHARSDTAENGVDVDYFAPQDVEKDPDELVFVGVMDYFPNEEGMEFFCQEILPIVRKSRPNCHISVVGARPSERAMALDKLAGVTVTGPVDDVRPYMAKASVAVVPLRLARGIQNKVLEAMSMGMPVVTSEAAFCGVDAKAGEHGLVADDPAELARFVLELLDDPERGRAMGAKSREIMKKRYSWDAQVAKLEDIYQTIRRERA